MEDENQIDEKKENIELNYAEKIETFKLMIENNNDDIALKYLQKANWDEVKAVRLYNNENLSNPQYYNTNISTPNLNYNYSNNYNVPKVKISNFDFSKYEHCPINIPQKQSLFSAFFSLFGPKNYPNEYGVSNFNKIKGYASNYELFISNLKNNKLGIFFIYDEKSILSMNTVINGIINNLSLLNLFNNKTVFPLFNLSEIGKDILSNIHITKFPIMLICKYKNQTSFVIIKKTKPGYLTLDSLKEAIQSAENIVKTNNKKISNTPYPNSQITNNNSNFDDYCFISNGDVIQQQKRDLEELERKEREKKEKERKLLEEKKREEKRIEEEKKKKIEEEKILKEKSIMLKNSLPPEPDDSNPNKCIIVFRYPDGSKNVEKKFLKNEKIQILYNYIESLGREIYTETYINKFILIQTFPFKYLENKDKTLEEEDLFPNAVLQIKEIDP